MTKTTGSVDKKAGRADIMESTFTLFRSYSDFIVRHYLDALVSDMIKNARERQVHVLGVQAGLSDREVFERFKKGLAEYVLIPVSEGRPFEKLEDQLRSWKKNRLMVQGEQLRITDITSLNNLCKGGLKRFLKFYKYTEEEKYRILDEIDSYFEISTDLGLKAYEEIHKLTSYNEHLATDHLFLSYKQEETEKELNNLIEGVKDYAIFKLNPDGTIASWNAGACSLKGYSEKEILGKHFSIFYPKEKRGARFPEYELEEAQKKGRFEDEGFRIKKDGSQFWANVVITPIYNKENKLTGYTKITRDLSERKAWEDSLHRMNKELEEKVKQRTGELSKTVAELTKINNDLDNFIYTASHDLKAPVSNIEGLIQALFEEFEVHIKNNKNLQTFKKLINTSVKRFQKTIRELTEIAKIQKNFTEETETVDLYDVVKDVKNTIQQLIVKNDAEIICDFREQDKIRFARKNINSIFYNLISNGIKYRSPERKPVIVVNSITEGEYTLLSFKDNGLGFKQENMEKIFTMFKRFHDHVEGSGIGLYIVKRIIENAGGKIEVESEEGQGSTFKVYIPLS